MLPALHAATHRLAFWQVTHSFPLQTVIMSSTKCLQLSVLPYSHQATQLCTLYMQYSCHVWEREHSWSGHLKSPGNHWLSLVLMKENNSLTCAKTVQKQPFLMSDTSRPLDTFYVSNSLIKQHPREWDTGAMKHACERECTSTCVCVCKLLPFELSGVILERWSSHNKVQSRWL